MITINVSSYEYSYSNVKYDGTKKELMRLMQLGKMIPVTETNKATGKQNHIIINPAMVTAITIVNYEPEYDEKNHVVKRQDLEEDDDEVSDIYFNLFNADEAKKVEVFDEDDDSIIEATEFCKIDISRCSYIHAKFMQLVVASIYGQRIPDYLENLETEFQLMHNLVNNTIKIAMASADDEVGVLNAKLNNITSKMEKFVFADIKSGKKNILKYLDEKTCHEHLSKIYEEVNKKSN